VKNYNLYSDEELVESYRLSGDIEVFSALFIRYSHLILGVCLKYLKNKEDAKDELMNIYEKASTELINHKIEHFRGWVYVISRNHCLMKLRKEKNNKQVPFEEVSARFMESSEEWHPLNSERESDKESKLTACMESLGKEQKSCVKEFYFDKLSYQQIAVKFGISEGNVKSHIQNGKRNLKICIERSQE